MLEIAREAPPSQESALALDKGFCLGDWLVRPEWNLLVRRHRSLWRGIRDRRGSIGRNAHRVDLEPKPMQLLVALARVGGEVVSREQLRMVVWQRDYITDEVITVAVRALRKALGDDAQNPLYIQTFPGQGYRLVCEVEALKSHWTRGVAKRTLVAISLVLALAMGFFRGAEYDTSDPVVLPQLEIPESAVLAPAIPGLGAEDGEAFLRARYVVWHGDGRQLESAGLVLDDLIVRHPGEAALLVTAANARLLAFQFFGLRQHYLDEASALLARADADQPAGSTGVGALGAKALVRYYRDWDIAGADALFRDALAADAGDILSRRNYARFLGEQNRIDEAWRILASLEAPDPASFEAGDAARLLYFEGRYAEAINRLEMLLALRGGTPGEIYWSLALNLTALGRHDEAMEAVIRHYEHRAYDAGFIDILKRRYEEGGWQAVHAHFRDFFIGLKARGAPLSPVRIARHALGAGDQQEAIRRLRKAMEARDPAILSIRVDPAFRELRGLPVFDSLVAQIQGSAEG